MCVCMLQNCTILRTACHCEALSRGRSVEFAIHKDLKECHPCAVALHALDVSIVERLFVCPSPSRSPSRLSRPASFSLSRRTRSTLQRS